MKPTWLIVVTLLLGLVLSAASSMAQSEKQDVANQQLKQIKLTEKQVKSFISAQKQIAPLASKLESAGDKPDPALQGQLEQIAKSNGFSSFEEMDDVAANVSVVLAGLDSKTGQFTEPPDQIKKEIDEIKQDKQMPQQEKDQALSEMQEALKTAAPLQFKENVALVKKYQNELDQVLQQEPAKQ
jgi:hypothetical protein